MTVMHAVLNRVVQAVAATYTTGLGLPATYAPPRWHERGGTEPAKRAGSGESGAPVAGDGSAG
jgi:hypothetical protein